MSRLVPGYYLARVYGSKAYRPQFPWMVRKYDGQDWWDLGREGRRSFPSCNHPHSGLILLEEPTETGKHLTMWEDRETGFYWFWYRWRTSQEGQWEIAEFKTGNNAFENGYWIWADNDEAFSDNDMSDYPIVGPIQLPSI